MQDIRPFILGTTGFLLFFIYDINSVLWKRSVIQKFFAAGCCCVVISALWASVIAHCDGTACPPVLKICFIIGSLVFLILLFYTLFFALPFDETYREESRERTAFTEGIYGLCRHPGVLWFAGAYLCLWGMSGASSQGIYFISMIFWNYLYIVFQDTWVFPRTFTNYAEYKQQTPFLIPNRKSIRACFTYIRRHD